MLPCSWNNGYLPYPTPDNELFQSAGCLTATAMTVIQKNSYAGSIGCSSSHCLSASFMRVCHPLPVALNAATTAESSRMVTCSFVPLTIALPRRNRIIKAPFFLATQSHTRSHTRSHRVTPRHTVSHRLGVPDAVRHSQTPSSDGQRRFKANNMHILHNDFALKRRRDLLQAGLVEKYKNKK